MKKTIFLPALAFAPALVLGLSSCSSNNSETTSSFTMTAKNLITDIDKGETFASDGSYKFDLNYTQGTAMISSDKLIINNQTMSFTTAATTFLTDAYGYQVKVVDPVGYVQGNQSLQLENATFLVTPFINVVTDTNVPGYVSYPGAYQVLLAQYSLSDEYRIRTFLTDAFYKGTTTTMYPGADGMSSFESKDMIYRIVLYLDKKTADMIIYNAKFSASPMEPLKKAIIVKDMTLAYDTNGYTITGKDIIPEVLEAGGTTPYPDFVFNSVDFQTANEDLTECSISYQVAGRFNGEFKGSFLINFSESSEQ